MCSLNGLGMDFRRSSLSKGTFLDFLYPDPVMCHANHQDFAEPLSADAVAGAKTSASADANPRSPQGDPEDHKNFLQHVFFSQALPLSRSLSR